MLCLACAICFELLLGWGAAAFVLLVDVRVACFIVVCGCRSVLCL